VLEARPPSGPAPPDSAGSKEEVGELGGETCKCVTALYIDSSGRRSKRRAGKIALGTRTGTN